MATEQDHDGAGPAGPTRYRITANGKAVAAWEQHDRRTRHLTDLLHLLQSCAQGMAEAQMRQFMPADSLMRAIASLKALGLIEPHDAHEAGLKAQVSCATPQMMPPGAGTVRHDGVRRY